jgi:hypothetical protein
MDSSFDWVVMKNDPSYVAMARVLYAYFYTRAHGVGGHPGIRSFKAMRFSKLYKTAHSEGIAPLNVEIGGQALPTLSR